jgi:hypothetical protein
MIALPCYALLSFVALHMLVRTSCDTSPGAEHTRQGCDSVGLCQLHRAAAWRWRCCRRACLLLPLPLPRRLLLLLLLLWWAGAQPWHIEHKCCWQALALQLINQHCCLAVHGLQQRLP